jgi:acyl-CoA thioesterase FadM
LKKIERCTPQHVVIAEMNVKYHSNLKRTDLFIVENASQITDLKDVVETDLEEDLDSIDKERCTPQHVVIAEMNVKYHSNLKKTDLFIVENASQITDRLLVFRISKNF